MDIKTDLQNILTKELVSSQLRYNDARLLDKETPGYMDNYNFNTELDKLEYKIKRLKSFPKVYTKPIKRGLCWSIGDVLLDEGDVINVNYDGIVVEYTYRLQTMEDGDNEYYNRAYLENDKGTLWVDKLDTEYKEVLFIKGVVITV